MIDVVARVTIVAADDAEADAVYQAIHAGLHAAGLHGTYPGTPIVNITEMSREVGG